MTDSAGASRLKPRTRLWAGVVAPLALVGFGQAMPNVAKAAAPDKVFVCKYVGTPGVDEVLQTGNNPISVSVNSIEGPVVIGAFFEDAQGRSLVLAFDIGQQEPDVSKCRAPEGRHYPPSPPPSTPPTPPPTPPTPPVGVLPQTGGSPVAPLAARGALMLGIGCAMLAVARHRARA